MGHNTLLALTSAIRLGIIRTLGGGGASNLLEFWSRKISCLPFFLSCLFQNYSFLCPSGPFARTDQGLQNDLEPRLPHPQIKGWAGAPLLKHQPSRCSWRLPLSAALFFGCHHLPAGDRTEAPPSKKGSIRHTPAPTRRPRRSLLCPCCGSSLEFILPPPRVWFPGYLFSVKA